ncbi:phosphoenolpyruvate carboxylase [Serpens gallinarum]|uniref:Phosphoenolpyruvate carboxylase n=1 Tax=Serpens gallinarum TaxID=2763075 RepID=A0ABR8TPL8_9PSED|nr:phosphoenolpyruvate carboxylase [Serpens gallinarum]MBD7977475.1 phosphoenolpyruvate carboxylase [Serpens gallinarum]
MSGNLHQAGVRFLRQLGRHAEPIMDAYLAGSVSDEALEPGVQERLVKDGVLYRPEPGADLHLRRSVRALLEEALKDDRNRQIDANTGATLATFKTLAAHYTEARHQGDFAAADAYLADLREHVYSFCEGLTHSIRMLWSRINNEFGYVGSLNAKIRENELAQAQVSELLVGLELIDFQNLADTAGDLRELRRLLVSSLQRNVSDSYLELGVVQGRLLDLLGRFRKIRGRTRLLRGWSLHVEQQPDYQPGQHTALPQMPQLLNLAESLLAPAAVDIHDSVLEADLLALAAQVRAQREERPLVALPEAGELTLNALESFEVETSPIQDAVQDYFCQVIETGQPISALSWRAEQRLSWDEETWLYQVIGGYEALPDEQKDYFELLAEGDDHPVFSGNYIVRDLSLCLSA